MQSIKSGKLLLNKNLWTLEALVCKPKEVVFETFQKELNQVLNQRSVEVRRSVFMFQKAYEKDRTPKVQTRS